MRSLYRKRLCIALLICSAPPVVCKCAYIIMLALGQTQTLDALSPAFSFFAEHGGMVWLAGVLSLIGLNSFKWENKNTQPLFWMGLAVAASFMFELVSVYSELLSDAMTWRLFMGWAVTLLTLLAAYAAEFRMAKTCACN